MSEITPGPKLDFAIANAIGLESTRLYSDGQVFITTREWDEIRGIEHPTCEGGIACIPFQPSSDLNAAFAAAEKAGVFGDSNVTVSCHKEGQWRVERRIALRDGETLAIQLTPALAVCAAILKLKDKDE